MNDNLFNHKENKKIKVAIDRLNTHVSAFKSFEEFEPYFKDIVKTDDKDMLNNLLLQMLFYLLKTNKKHNFDILLESVEEAKKKQLENWLKANLDKISKQ